MDTIFPLSGEIFPLFQLSIRAMLVRQFVCIVQLRHDYLPFFKLCILILNTSILLFAQIAKRKKSKPTRLKETYIQIQLNKRVFL